MKAYRCKSPVAGMYSYRIFDDAGRGYSIYKDAQGRLALDGTSAKPPLGPDERKLFGDLSCVEEQKAIQKLIRACEARIARKSKDAAMEGLGLTKVKGALGGTYYE